MTVNLTNGTATDGYNGAIGLLALGGTDTLISIENVEGSKYNDTLKQAAQPTTSLWAAVATTS